MAGFKIGDTPKISGANGIAGPDGALHEVSDEAMDRAKEQAKMVVSSASFPTQEYDGQGASCTGGVDLGNGCEKGGGRGGF